MSKLKWMTAIFAATVMLFAFTACGSSDQEAADTEETTAAAEATVVTNDGLNLSIPAEYAELLAVETPENSEDGMLFVVSEQASIDAAKAEGSDVEGAGWLFSIGRIDGEKLHEMLAGEMSGSEPFAVDADGNHYVFYHPTDVRLIRADNEEMDAAMDEWTALNEWASTIPDSFIAENEGLEKETYGNTDLNIDLARIAYTDDVKYTVSTTEFGPLEPGDVDPKPYVEKLEKGVVYEETDMEAPDGEYVVLTFPDENVRYDFFKLEGSENVIRKVSDDDEENAVFYQATFQDDSLKATEIMQDWYDALAKAAGKK